MNNNSRAQELLDKVYDHLNSIDVTKLSMRDLQEFLEVLQKGQFLESYGKVPSYGLGGFGGAFTNPRIKTTDSGLIEECKSTDDGK